MTVVSVRKVFMRLWREPNFKWRGLRTSGASVAEKQNSGKKDKKLFAKVCDCRQNDSDDDDDEGKLCVRSPSHRNCIFMHPRDNGLNRTQVHFGVFFISHKSFSHIRNVKLQRFVVSLSCSSIDKNNMDSHFSWINFNLTSCYFAILYSICVLFIFMFSFIVCSLVFRKISLHNVLSQSIIYFLYFCLFLNWKNVFFFHIFLSHQWATPVWVPSITNSNYFLHFNMRNRKKNAFSWQ